MERKSAAKRRTKNKTKKQPLRVVYISNPMKITASASDFRATVQRLTGKGAVWPSDLEFSDTQTTPNTMTKATTTSSSDNNVSIISDDSDCGAELFATPNPSPDTSAASDDLYFQPSDLPDPDPDHDAVLLLDQIQIQSYGLPEFNDQEFESLIESEGLNFFDYIQPSPA